MQTVSVAVSAEERQCIYRFRYHVFSKHLGRTDLDGLNHERQELVDELDESSAHYYIGNIDAPMASVSVSPVDTRDFSNELGEFLKIRSLSQAVPLEHVAFVNWLLVNPQYAGTSAIVQLIAAVYEDALAKNVNLVLTFCRPSLVNFYERLGFEQYTHSTNLKNIGLRCPLLLVVSDRARLKAVRSPLYRILSRSSHASASTDIRLELEPIIDNYQAAQILINDELWLDDAVRFTETQRPNLLDLVSGDAVRFLMTTCTVISCKAGEKVIAYDETSDDMYLIVSGTFMRKSRHNEVEQILRQGDIFGEVEHLAGSIRGEEVTSVTAGHVIALKASNLFQWMRQDPKAGVEVAINLARQVALRFTK